MNELLLCGEKVDTGAGKGQGVGKGMVPGEGHSLSASISTGTIVLSYGSTTVRDKAVIQPPSNPGPGNFGLIFGFVFICFLLGARWSQSFHCMDTKLIQALSIQHKKEKRGFP